MRVVYDDVRPIEQAAWNRYEQKRLALSRAKFDIEIAREELARDQALSYFGPSVNRLKNALLNLAMLERQPW